MTTPLERFLAEPPPLRPGELTMAQLTELRSRLDTLAKYEKKEFDVIVKEFEEGKIDRYGKRVPEVSEKDQGQVKEVRTVKQPSPPEPPKPDAPKEGETKDG